MTIDKAFGLPIQQTLSDSTDMKLIDANTLNSTDKTLVLENTVDPSSLDLQGVDCVELNFPKFTDGRAFTQAVILRKRCGFKGDVRARGDVLIDQLLQMQRTGFSSAVLRADQNASHGQKLLSQFTGFYQGDVTEIKPHFART
jgi:uncharacterized protein (DUF934 family)